jgi:hypothetical protein
MSLERLKEAYSKQPAPPNSGSYVKVSRKTFEAYVQSLKPCERFISNIDYEKGIESIMFMNVRVVPCTDVDDDTFKFSEGYL